MRDLELSVVVPTLNEAEGIGALLADLGALSIRSEVIVVDAQSEDGTAQIARDFGATVMVTSPGRGRQLMAGAELARAPMICFLHADSRLDGGAIDALSRVGREGTQGAFVFPLRIAAPGTKFRLLEVGANLRTRWLGLPYGDQGLLVHRGDYVAAGGYPPVPLMEDVALALALRRRVGFRFLEGNLTVSPRRWQREGVFRRTLQNQILLLRYLTGAAPENLAPAYQPDAPRS